MIKKFFIIALLMSVSGVLQKEPVDFLSEDAWFDIGVDDPVCADIYAEVDSP